MTALRNEVDRIDEWGRRNVRWWVGIDIAERHILASPEGVPKVIDLFGLSSALLDDLVADPLAFARLLPADRRRYLLDMPDLQSEDHPADYVSAIRAALDCAASTPRSPSRTQAVEDRP